MAIPGQKPTEGLPPDVEVKSEGEMPKTEEQLNQSLPVEQTAALPVLNKPEVNTPKVAGEAAVQVLPVQKAVPVENKEQTEATVNRIISEDLRDARKLANYISGQQM